MVFSSVLTLMGVYLSSFRIAQQSGANAAKPKRRKAKKEITERDTNRLDFSNENETTDITIMSSDPALKEVEQGL